MHGISELSFHRSDPFLPQRKAYLSEGREQARIIQIAVDEAQE